MVTKIYYIGADDTVVFAASELKRVFGTHGTRIGNWPICALQAKTVREGYWLGLCDTLGEDQPVVEESGAG